MIFTEQQLLKGCIKNDRKCQEALYDLYAEDMFGVCLGYSGDHDSAKDILQEGFIKVFKNIKKFKGKGSLKSWIRKIIVNTAIDHYRQAANQRVFTEIEDDAYIFIEENVLSQINTDELLGLIQKLPGGYRTVFNLYAVEGFSHKEIAEKLQINIGTSKSQLFRAKRLLQGWVLQLDEEKEIMTVIKEIDLRC
ncbi:MAG: RNA polymerase sigma factor [Bacteroidetes bacterium]|nr:RNA polymerase sigma factor [Bacteroidota bacterium]